MSSAGKWILGLMVLVLGAVFVARAVSSDPASSATVKNLPSAETVSKTESKKPAAPPAPATDVACKKACIEVNEVANDSVTTAKLAPGSVTLSKLAFEVPNLNELTNEINARKAAEAASKAATAETKAALGEAAAATAKNDAAITAAAQNGLVAEAAARNAAVDDITKKFTAGDADLLGRLNKEIADRGAGDDVLQLKLNAEIADRAGAINTLRGELANPNQVAAPIIKINNNEIVGDAVTTDKLLDRTILAQDLAIGSVTTNEILNGTIRGADVTTDDALALTGANVKDGSLTTADVTTTDALALTGANIKDNSLTANDLGTGSVDNDELAGNAVTTAKILNRTIKSEDLEENAITSFELANNSVDTAAVQAGAITNVELRSTAGTEAVNTNVIRSGAVTNDKLASTVGSEAVNTNVIRDEAVTGAKIAPLTITAANLVGNDKDNAMLLQVRAVSARALADGAVTNRAITDGAISLTKLDTDVATQDELNAATTGDNSPLNNFKKELANTGPKGEGASSKPNDATDPVSFNKVKDIDPDILLKKAADVVCVKCVENGDINDLDGSKITGAITTATIAGSKVTGDLAAIQIRGDLANATIDGGNITGTIDAASISGPGTLNVSVLAENSITGSKLALASDKDSDSATTSSAPSGVVNNHIEPGTIHGDRLADASTNPLVAGAGITAAKLEPNSITALHIGSGQISTDELAAGAVTTAKQTANSVSAMDATISSSGTPNSPGGQQLAPTFGASLTVPAGTKSHQVLITTNASV
ncbi:MAG: hypothetical protein KY458_06740, partial [Actinobacteria bacterium]|nr:hypothetical protein [Actinomycetota bacterium]